MQHVVFSGLKEAPVPPLCGSKRCPFSLCVLSMAMEGWTVSCLLKMSYQLKSLYDLQLSM